MQLIMRQADVNPATRGTRNTKTNTCTLTLTDTRVCFDRVVNTGDGNRGAFRTPDNPDGIRGL
jgi:hypothetical protein